MNNESGNSRPASTAPKFAQPFIFLVAVIVLFPYTLKLRFQNLILRHKLGYPLFGNLDLVLKERNVGALGGPRIDPANEIGKLEVHAADSTPSHSSRDHKTGGQP